MAMQKAHSSIPWVDYPKLDTPLNAQNLLKEDTAIDVIDDRVISLDTTKFDKTEAQGLFKDVELDPKTGIITFTTYSGAKKTIDTLLEKIAINFDFDEETQKIIITLEDGTTKEVDLKSFITEYEFLDSETIAFTVDTAGKVTAIVKEGSIQEKHLRPDYLADIRVESAKAEAASSAAELSAGNAKKSETAAAESASKSADAAEEAAGSATAAAGSASTATAQATSASNSAQAAKASETNAATSASNAKASADTATSQATAAAGSASTATTQANAAKNSATEAAASATKAKSYTEGGTGTRENEDTDNAKNYYEESKKIYDSFVSTGNVTGVKGSAETDYRHGNVNLTPENIGALALTGGTLTGRTTGLVSNGHYDTTAVLGSGYYKIAINSTIDWMLGFTIRVYQGYRLTDIVISGYNYVENHWYLPSAIIEGDSRNESIAVTFGYDSVNHLWVAIPSNAYTGLDIFNVTNGYRQVDDYGNLFTITQVASLSGTTQITITAYPPATTNQIPTTLPANGGTADTISTTLPILKGGTGATTANGAANNILIGTNPGTNPLNGWSLTDVDRMVFEGNSGGAVNSKFYRTPMTKVFDYLNAKTFNNAKNSDTVDGKHAADLQDYNNLANKPAIPAAANNGTLTIQRNGSTIATFTANSSTNVTANIQDTDTNTDVNVTQTLTTANANYPILLSSTTTTGTRGALFDSGVTLNPSTNVIAANVSGSAGSVAWNNVSGKPTIPAAVAVKGNAESAYRTGNVNITPANIGLGNVNNTADANKSVASSVKWNGYSLWVGTKAQYNALSKNASTLYVING